MELAWKEVLGFSVTAGLVTWLLNQGATTARDWHKSRNESKYFALRVVLVLERFGIDCASAISDYQTMLDSHGAAGGPIGELPSLVFDGDIDWKALDGELVEETLLLPNEIVFANASIDFALGEAMEGDNFTESMEQAGLCGYRAVLLADRLRLRYKLPRFRKLVSQWDFRTILKQHHDEKLADYEAMNKYA